MDIALRSALTSESSGSARPSLIAAARLSPRPIRGPLIPVFTPMSSSRSTHRTRVFMDTTLLVPTYIKVFGRLMAAGPSREAQSFLDPAQFDRGGLRPHDGAMGVRDHACAHLSDPVVRGRDRHGDLEGLLEGLDLAGAGVRMTEGALVRRDGDGADGPDAGPRAAHDGHVQDLADQVDGFVVVRRVHDRAVVVAEHIVADRTQPMRARIDGS